MITAASRRSPVIASATMTNPAVILAEQPLPEFLLDEPVELSSATFSYSLSAPLVERSTTPDSRWTTIKAAVDDDVFLVCRLKGERITGSEKARSEELAIHFEVQSSRPQAHFVAATLQAILGLGKSLRLHIPALQLTATLNFSAPLNKVSTILRARAAAYRMMVIERVLNVELSFPEQLSDLDFMRIAFVYYALIERTKVWAFHQDSFCLPADETTRACVEDGQPFTYQFTDPNFEYELFDRWLRLGETRMTLTNAVFVNPSEVRRELARPDGRDIHTLLRTLDGIIKYDFLAAPQFSELNWAEQTEKLIRLEPSFDQRFMTAINDLAAATVAGLTEEEIAEITQRPELDEEAFADPVINGED